MAKDMPYVTIQGAIERIEQRLSKERGKPYTISRQRIHQLLKARQIEGIKQGGTWLFNTASLDAWEPDTKHTPAKYK